MSGKTEKKYWANCRSWFRFSSLKQEAHFDKCLIFFVLFEFYTKLENSVFITSISERTQRPLSAPNPNWLMVTNRGTDSLFQTMSQNVALN